MGEDIQRSMMFFPYSGLFANMSNFIFNYTNRSEKLFPKDILEEKAKAIRESKHFSRKAFFMAKERYFSSVDDDTIQGWLQDENINIQESPTTSFTEREKQDFYTSWEKNKETFLGQIIVRKVRPGGTIDANKK